MPHRIGLLEGVIADEMRRHLAGQADNRNAVHQCIGQPSHRVGGAGPGGHQQHAGLAGGPGIALRCVGRALFMAHQNVTDAILLKQRIINGQDRATAVAKHHFDTLSDQGFEQYFSAGHHLAWHSDGSFNTLFDFNGSAPDAQ